jgi:hypothetical protein
MTYVYRTQNEMDKETIAKVFKNTGIYLVNQDIFTDKDFAPSHATSAYANVPESYPPEIQSLSPFIPLDAESDLEYEQESDGSMNNASPNNSSQPDQSYQQIRCILLAIL